MGGKKSAKAPAPPDYSAIAAQQGDNSKEVASAVTNWNRPTQTDAFGNQISWSQDANGKYYQNQTMNPLFQASQASQLGSTLVGQQIYRNQLDQLNWMDQNGQMTFNHPDLASFNQQQIPNLQTIGPPALRQASAGAMPTMGENGVQGGAMPTLGGTSVNAQGMPVMSGTGLTAGDAVKPGAMPTMGANGIQRDAMPVYDESNGKAVSDALYKSVADRALPQQQRERDMLTTQLRQQGLQPGTEAFDRAMKNTLTSQGDVLAQAANQATIGGYDEARQRYMAQLSGNNQSFGQQMGVAQNNRDNFGMQLGAQNQGFNQQMNSQQQQFGQQQAAAQNSRDNYLTQLGAQNQNFQQQVQGAQNSRDTYASQLSGQNQGFQQQVQGAQNTRDNFLSQLGAQNQGYNQSIGLGQDVRANNDQIYKQQQQQFDQQMGLAQNSRDNYITGAAGQAQQFGQAQTEYNQNWQDAAMAQGLGGSGMSPSFPGFGGATGYQPADMLGAANANFAAQMGGFNSSQNKKGGLMGSGMGLLGSFLGR